MTLNPRAIALVAVLASVAPGARGQDQCAPIFFGADRLSVNFSGIAIPDGSVCYTLNAPPDMTFTLKTSGGNISVFIDDSEVDPDTISFQTKAHVYKIAIRSKPTLVSNEKYNAMLSLH